MRRNRWSEQFETTALVNDVRAAVSQRGELTTGLLGMTALNQLEGVSLTGDVMTLKQ